MTKQEYENYRETVDAYISGGPGPISTGPCPGCAECGIPADAETYSEEPWFSWAPCEICQRGLGGNRVSWHGVNPETGEIIHGTCCEDCAYYLEMGCLDDATMDEIARTPE